MNTPTRRIRTLLPVATLALALVIGGATPAHALSASNDAENSPPQSSSEQPSSISQTAVVSASEQDATEERPKAEEGAATAPDVAPTLKSIEKVGENSAEENPQERENNDPLTAYANITMERYDANKDDARVYVGDVVEWDITYTNKTTDTTLSFHPTQANIENTAIMGNSGFCRWRALAPGKSAHCRGTSLAFLRITQSHVGTTITPEVTFTVNKGDEVIVENYVVRGTPFTVQEGTRPEPSETPTPRVDGEAIELARHNKAGFTCYRIPALTTAPNGDLLAAWDGRPDSCSDAPNPNSIVQRVSKDGGQSWSKPSVIAAGVKGAAKYGYSDPSYVVDREANKVFMFFVKSYDQSYFGSRPGTDDNQRDVLHAAVMESHDNGASWGPIKTITAAITADPATMRSRFAASGEGIQLRHPAHKGRLIQQFTYAVTRQGAPEEWKAVSVYSDDHGVTWKAGVPVGAGMDENKVVELSDGTVMLNSRASSGGAPGVKARRVTYSTDGGHSYGDVTVRYDLVDQNNNAGLTRAFPDVPETDWRSKIILFTNTANAGARDNGTVKVSYDDGKTWAIAKEFYAPHTGYSTITPLPHTDGTRNSGKYGILFEKDATGISYMQISDEWLGLYRAFPSGQDREVKRGGNIVTFTVENRASAPLEGATLTASLPAGWKLAHNPSSPLDQLDTSAAEGNVSLDIPASIPVGETATITAKVLVPADQDAGSVHIPLTLTNAQTSTAGAVKLTVTLDQEKGEKNSQCQAGVAITNSPPSETRNEATNYTNMVDGDPATIWHTPWASRHVPIDVEFSLTRTETLKDLLLMNRQDSKNGRIREAELSLVENGVSHPVAASITDMGDLATVSLEPLAKHVGLGERATLRLHITSTDAGNAAQRNTFASLAEICAREVYPSTALHDEVPALPLQPSTPLTPQDPPSSEPPATPSYKQGSTVRIEMKGFTPNSEVTFEVHSDPLIIGTSTANEHGVAVINWTIPRDFAPGNHTIVARDTTGATVRQPIVITGKDDTGNPPSQNPQTPQKPPVSPTPPSTPNTPGDTTPPPHTKPGATGDDNATKSDAKKNADAAKKSTQGTLARTGATVTSAASFSLILAALGMGAYLMRRKRQSTRLR